jgi:ABC-type transport system involved in multi-copper enzyme maturation permease subunit
VQIQNETVFIWQNVVYAIVYSAALLVLAIIVFDRREV